VVYFEATPRARQYATALRASMTAVSTMVIQSLGRSRPRRRCSSMKWLTLASVRSKSMLPLIVVPYDSRSIPWNEM
jgi:hypothetical protein